MKAIAKQDFGYPEYPYTNWIAGNKYDVRVDEEGFTTNITDEQLYEFHFCGEPKHLEDRFDFVEDEK